MMNAKLQALVDILLQNGVGVDGTDEQGRIRIVAAGAQSAVEPTARAVADVLAKVASC